MSLKEKLMDQMMDKQFGNLSAEEKQKMMEMMMEKFFSGISDNEKKEMMGNMMSRMMGGMAGNPMMGMMKMMGDCGKGDKKNGKMPWDRCMEMMTGFKETANTAKFATPELRGLFEEWCDQIEKELLESVKESKEINVKALCDKFNLSEVSIKYLLNQLASKNLIEYKI
jgi:hypothetical protein